MIHLILIISQNYEFSCNDSWSPRPTIGRARRCTFGPGSIYDVRVTRYNAHETRSMVMVETAVVGRPRLIAALQTPRRLGITRLINLPTGCVAGLEYRQR